MIGTTMAAMGGVEGRRCRAGLEVAVASAMLRVDSDGTIIVLFAQ